jgi:hypothetical protein
VFGIFVLLRAHVSVVAGTTLGHTYPHLDTHPSVSEGRSACSVMFSGCSVPRSSNVTRGVSPQVRARCERAQLQRREESPPVIPCAHRRVKYRGARLTIVLRTPNRAQMSPVIVPHLRRSRLVTDVQFGRPDVAVSGSSILRRARRPGQRCRRRPVYAVGPEDSPPGLWQTDHGDGGGGVVGGAVPQTHHRSCAPSIWRLSWWSPRTNGCTNERPPVAGDRSSVRS